MMTKVLSPVRILQYSTVLAILLLSPHVLHCTGRRGVTTHATDRPADLYFVMKLIQPCGGGRYHVGSVARDEVINMVQIVGEEVNEAKHDMVSYLFKII